MSKRSCRSRTATALLSVALLGTLIGCASPATQEDIELGETQPYDGEGPTREQLQANQIAKGCTNRTDFDNAVIVTNGPFGSWADNCFSFCPIDYFAYAINVRSEPNQGGGDDSGLNAISLHCYHRSQASQVVYVTDQAGGWGSWGATAYTDPYTLANPVMGGTAKVEWSQQSGDDTALNAIAFWDKDSAGNDVLFPQWFSSWGHWLSPFTESAPAIQSNLKCETGTAVCGIMTRLEAPQGGGDDTKLNGFYFACCDF